MILRRLLLCALVLAWIGACSIAAVSYRLHSNIERIEGVFDGLQDRPRRAGGAAGEAQNILVLGVDRHATDGCCSVMIVHVDADRRAMRVISIPRDAAVPIPGHGVAPLEEAHARGGERLTVQAVEQLTDVRIDHLAVVDWTELLGLADTVGGVAVRMPAPSTDPELGVTWPPGVHRLDSRRASAYLSQTVGLADGDLERIRRRQAVLDGLMENALHQEMRKDPLLLFGFADTATGSLSVDEDWSLPQMLGLGISLRSLRSRDITYLTAPAALVHRRGPPRVILDWPANQELWRAVREDRVDSWLAEHPQHLAPEATEDR